MSNYFISAGIELQDGADLKEAESGLRLLAEVNYIEELGGIGSSARSDAA